MSNRAHAPGATRAEQAARTRDDILDVALACIDQAGLEQASASAIARRAGTTWGAVQHHFGTRDELLLSLIERSVRELAARLEDAAVEGESRLDRLQAFADLVWNHCRDPRYRVSWEIILEFRRRPEAAAAYAQRLVTFEHAIDDAWGRLLRETLGGADDRIVRRIIFATMRGLALDAHTNPNAGEATQERAYLVRLIADDLTRRVTWPDGSARG